MTHAKKLGLMALVLALVMAIAMPVLAEGWKDKYKELKFGILSGENEKDRVARYTGFKNYLEKTLGVPVKIFTASSYAGVIQAMAAGQIHFAFYGSSSYAAAWKEMNGNINPILSRVRNTGSTGYFSVIVVRKDSPYKKLDDLKGKIMAFADPNSTSGYAVPYYNLKNGGYNPETFFGKIPFSGAHETGVLGVINGQFDACATYITSEQDGIPMRMVRKGMIKPDLYRIIWKSPEITTGPVTAHGELPQDLIDDFTLAVFRIGTEDPKAFNDMRNKDQIAWISVNHDRYAWIIKMRDEIKKMKRARGNKK
jgi:phosphonate transport system substrate-binding protein